jgi:hypothetical protein
MIHDFHSVFVMQPLRDLIWYTSGMLDMLSLPQIFRSNLQARIDELGLSYAEVGRRVGLDRSGVKQYLDGKRIPGLVLLAKFSEALDLTPAQLISPVEEKIPS